MKNDRETKLALVKALMMIASSVDHQHEGTHMTALVADIVGQPEVGQAMKRLCEPFHQIEQIIMETVEGLIGVDFNTATEAELKAIMAEIDAADPRKKLFNQPPSVAPDVLTEAEFRRMFGEGK
jgi:hypothetical protein